MITGTTEGEQLVEAAPQMSERHLRADAQRNRERILEAATSLMATHGIDVPVDEIAQRAQVGVGTVYRNFPTKGALFEALLMARITPLVAAARSAAAADDPGEAFVSFVRRLCDEFADFKALADAMAASGVDLSATKQEISGDLIDAVTELLQKAQQAGLIRPDVTITDVSAMMAGLSHADPLFMDAPQRQRCVALVCDSLLVGARSVLPLGELASSSPAHG
ncbi:MAG: TetR/AcrR family transcriptional regulator [Candidatus Dormiibacterota bacterium]